MVIKNPTTINVVTNRRGPQVTKIIQELQDFDNVYFESESKIRG